MGILIYRELPYIARKVMKMSKLTFHLHTEIFYILAMLLSLHAFIIISFMAPSYVLECAVYKLLTYKVT